MHVCRTIVEFRTARAQMQGSLGFVPTMGFLHAGHLSLVEAANAGNAHTAASIFVNPTQFNNLADLATYPRNEERDLALLEEAGVELVLLPSANDVYPQGFQTYVEVEKLTQMLEGEHRPGHFRGVATVVSKLFNMVQPTRAYFGQKDAQQVAVIKQMVRDLNFPLEIVVCPTLREADGLAMSSRNAKLSTQERRQAAVLYQALMTAQAHFDAGEHDPETLRRLMKAVLEREKGAKIDYVSAADAETLIELKTPLERPALLSMAIFIGSTRLIDNIVLTPE